MSENRERIDQDWASRSALYTFLALVAALGLPQIEFPIFDIYVQIPDILFLLACVLFLISLLLRQNSVILHWSYLALGAYLISLLISSLFSVSEKSSLVRFFEEGYLIGLAVLAINIIRSKYEMRLAIAAWLMGTLIAVAVGVFTIALFYLQPHSPLLEFLTYHYGSVPVGHYPRITAGFVSASMLCNYLNVSLVLVMYAMQAGFLRRRIAILCIFLIATASVFTFSIELGGIALAAGVWLWIASDQTKHMQLAALVVGSFVAFVFLIVSFFALAPYPDASIIATVPVLNIQLMPSARVMVWSDAITTFLAHPVTGLGLGLPVANVLFRNTEGDMSLLTDAHNSFLSVAAQNGILGLAAFSWLVLVMLKRCFKEVRRLRSASALTALGLAFVCSFVYQGLTGSFEEARHLWVLIGMFWAADRIERPTV